VLVRDRVRTSLTATRLDGVICGVTVAAVLVMLDLNGFKAYNESFGNAAGDALLCRLASSLSTTVSGRGQAYRLGGDEFCVVAPCDERGADRLSAICHGALSTRGHGFSITAAAASR
jgi:diguanylate cyclase (GGDEF)-like protein